MVTSVVAGSPPPPPFRISWAVKYVSALIDIIHEFSRAVHENTSPHDLVHWVGVHTLFYFSLSSILSKFNCLAFTVQIIFFKQPGNDDHCCQHACEFFAHLLSGRFRHVLTLVTSRCGHAYTT